MAEQTRLRVGQNGRIVIPALRKAEGVILLRIGDNELRITTQQRPIRRAQRRARRYLKSGASLVEGLLSKRRGAARNE
jgi:hypothetical protein